MMTQEQVDAYIRTGCTSVSMILATAIGFTAQQASTLQTGALGVSSLVFLGISLVGTWKAHTNQGLIASAATVPGTKVVTQPGLAAVTPENVTSNLETKVVSK